MAVLGTGGSRPHPEGPVSAEDIFERRMYLLCSLFARCSFRSGGCCRLLLAGWNRAGPEKRFVRVHESL